MSAAALRACLRALHGPGAVRITAHWTVQAGGGLDPTTGHIEGGTVTQVSGTYPCFFHEVTPAAIRMRMFAEVEEGDALVDLAPDVDLDGKVDLWFETADGRHYVQALTGGTLAKHFDATLAAGAAFRTIHLRRAT